MSTPKSTQEKPQPHKKKGRSYQTQERYNDHDQGYQADGEWNLAGDQVVRGNLGIRIGDGQQR